ncbi:MAG TPA: 3,4-dihydroxy-2-butanone-4-phosphate synthase [Sphingomonas sp.]|nr:3,4-dihydroxy-2-butanone-4-phosphate synthase [Sphingomonas sp.]
MKDVLSRNGPDLARPEEIIEEARNGRMFVLVDDEDRENEGDLVIPAQMATPEKVNFMACHGRGLICLAMTKARVDQLGLDPMSRNNRTRHATAFTVSIEAREGVSTGISASDRARTIATAIDHSKDRSDIVTPGHVFPLVAREGGVLVRAGHTEAAVDVARLAGLNPSGVICEIMNDDGTMARLHELIPFAARHNLKIGTIRDLIAYRRRFDRSVERVGDTSFQSNYGGEWRLLTYRDRFDGTDNFVLQKGSIAAGGETLVRMHTASLFSDLLGEKGARNRAIPDAMQQIARVGAGVIVLIVPRTDNGTSLHTTPSNDPDVDRRSYGTGAQILADLGVHDLVLLSSSQRPPLVGLEAYGLRIVHTQPFDVENEQPGIEAL